ncbi:hypothetical protein X945_5980 [Burkholderia pseudomallei ABCPW 107]|nr:hypothetical protein X989_5884 [Burkholderia pseudomallei MSHR4378]KGS34713.1 hypothetical protein X945_5980 [Burkholderia pseudomallei ABCPW 107]KGX94495.1 hypothetical protein X997_5834 [Burkholderia pseudomallei A79C]
MFLDPFVAALRSLPVQPSGRGPARRINKPPTRDIPLCRASRNDIQKGLMQYRILAGISQ